MAERTALAPVDAVEKDHTLLLRPRDGVPFVQLSLDAEGRWLRLQVAEAYAKRGTDSRVLVKERASHRRWRPRRMAAEEQRRLHQQVYGWVRAMVTDRRGESLPDSARAWLQRAAAWTPERLEAEALRHGRVYGRIPILPPDLYNAIVVQATLGCTYNRCSFCTFYDGIPFRPLTREEIERQLDGVEALYGRDLERHLKLFLGDANALVLSRARLESLWEVLDRRFAIDAEAAFGSARRDARGRLRVEGVYTFMDAFNTRRKERATLEWLAGRGLRRVYIGMESGSDRVLRFLAKPGTSRDVVDAVRSLKEAGIGVGVILLAGAGGRELQESHVFRTAERVNEMELGPDDAVFFSPLVVEAGGAWEAQARREGVVPLSDEEIEAEIGAIRGLLQFPREQAPRITRYDLREFIH